MSRFLTSVACWYAAGALMALGLGYAGLIAAGSVGAFAPYFGALALGLVAAFLFAREPGVGARWRLPLIALAVVPAMAWVSMQVSFGMIDMHAVLYHVRHGKGGIGMSHPIAVFNVVFSASVLAMLAAFTVAMSRRPVLVRWDRRLWLPLLVVNPFTFAIVEATGVLSDGDRDRLAKAYVVPAPRAPSNDLLVPAATGSARVRPSLIHIYLESAERAFAEPAFQGAMDPIMALEPQAFTATNMGQVSQTDWSMAGIVASQCGVPLIQPFLQSRNPSNADADFMTGAHCLGDVLAGDNYSISFVRAGDMDFAGNRQFHLSHGYDTIIGAAEIAKAEPRATTNDWGVDDEWLFAAARRRLDTLADERKRTGRPFYLSIEPLGAHPPDGFVTRACEDLSPPLKARIGMLRSLECVNRLTIDLLERARGLGQLENTIVVIQSDHLAMRNTVSAELAKHPRRNLFLVMGDGVAPGVSHRPSTMMDVYPTILAALGYALPDGRAGLGTDLRADRPTLSERWKWKDMSDAIVTDRHLKRHLWGEPGQLPRAEPRESEDIAAAR